jgi:hypothetical protein
MWAVQMFWNGCNMSVHTIYKTVILSVVFFNEFDCEARQSLHLSPNIFMMIILGMARWMGRTENPEIHTRF